MRSIKQRCLPAVVFAVLTVSTSAVQAEVWRDVFIGLNLFDYQVNGQRNYLGKGWDINATAVYAGQEYDFGFAELTLGSPVAPTASNISVGYTTRGIPKAEFGWNTGGRALPYTLEFNNGFQDFTTIDGSVLVDVSTDVNVLGFYDTRIQISNRANYSTDGFLANQDGNLNFDVGPIDVSGNIYADALAVVTAPLWAATGTDNPFAKFSERATKTAELNATIDELKARIAAGEILSDEEMAQLVNSTLVSAILQGEPGQSNLFQGLAMAFNKPGDTSAARLMVVPEPSSAFLLFGLGALFIAKRRRR
jgi:hypothetical protein